MEVLVSGSAGHLGEALMRTLPATGYEAVGLDIKPSPFTHELGSIVDRDFVDRCMRGVQAVVHTATLHKPHIETLTLRGLERDGLLVRPAPEQERRLAAAQIIVGDVGCIGPAKLGIEAIGTGIIMRINHVLQTHR
jgi:hypothetical protein